MRKRYQISSIHDNSALKNFHWTPGQVSVITRPIGCLPISPKAPFRPSNPLSSFSLLSSKTCGGGVNQGILPRRKSFRTILATPSTSASPPLRSRPPFRARISRNLIGVSKRSISYVRLMCCGFVFFRTAAIYCSGFSTFSTRTTPLRRMSSSESWLLGGTTPGQSIR